VPFVQAAMHHESRVLDVGSLEDARSAAAGLDVSAALRAQVQELLRLRLSAAAQVNGVLMGILADPRLSAVDFELAERLARGMPRGEELAIGLLHLRAGRLEAALSTADVVLRREGATPGDACYLHAIRVIALARLGRRQEASEALVTLRAICAQPDRARDPDSLAMLREAEDALGR
jgi:hypothetical protein